MSVSSEQVSAISIVGASGGRSEALARLFESADVPCHCRYWHFEGDKNAWLERCALSPEVNRTEMVAALERNDETMRGFVAMSSDGAAVGWLKLTESKHLDKLYSQRLYRGLPCFDGPREGIWAIGCILVDEAWRRQGVARRLLEAAIEGGRRRGARSIEAFPRRAEGVSDAQLWTGPVRLFLEAGFTTVHDFGPYPVLRLDL